MTGNRGDSGCSGARTNRASSMELIYPVAKLIQQGGEKNVKPVEVVACVAAD